MPNWCDNNVTLKGNEKDIKNFIEKLDKTMKLGVWNDLEDKEEKDFIRICESIKPMPDELNHVVQGGNKEGYEYWWEVDSNGNKFNENDIFMSKFGGELDGLEVTQVALTIEEMMDMILKYDAFCWYDWRLIHWGSKTGDLYTELTEINDTEIKLYCESAWNPVVNLFATISADFDLDVEIKWAEEAGYYGTIVIENGNIEKDEVAFRDIYNEEYMMNQEGDNIEEE